MSVYLVPDVLKCVPVTLHGIVIYMCIFFIDNWICSLNDIYLFEGRSKINWGEIIE